MLEKQERNSALLIEDDKACQRVMSIFLQKLAYEVTLVDEGEKALKMVQDI